MRKVKTYNLFLESSVEYSIYEWFEDIKRYQWGDSQKLVVNIKSLKLWSDHFIGEGYFDKISELVDKIFDSLKKVDIDTVNDRMYDVYDEIPSNKIKKTMYCVLNGDVENYDKPNRRRYNGYSTILDPNNNSKKIHTVIDILKSIVMPTLYIGYPSAFIRTTDNEMYVTDKKYQCQNFDISNYSLFSYSSLPSDKGFDVRSADKSRTVTIHQSDITKKKKYDIDKILDMYRPGIIIHIGGHDGHLTGAMNLRKLEANIDEVLISILPVIDYEEIIFDAARYDRQFDDNTDIYDYDLKILLKL